MLSSHSVVSSSRTVRPCSPSGGRWIGHWRTTWSTVCSSAPHSQAAEEAIPQLYKQEQKRSTPVRRRLSQTQVLLGRVISGGWVPVSGIKMRSFVGLSAHPTFHWWSAHCAARMMLLSDEQMSCAAGTNGCLDLRRRAFALDGRVSAEWSRCPGSIARRPRDSVATLRRSSAGWMAARVGRLSAGVGRMHPVTIRKASLMAGSMRRVWALRHQTGAQYSAVECTRVSVGIRRVVAPAPNRSQQAASGARRVMSASCEVTQGVGDTWATCPTLLRGIWARSSRAGFVVVFDFQLTFSFLVKMEGCRHCFCSAEL